MSNLQQQFSGRGPRPPESETLVTDPTLDVLTCSREDLSLGARNKQVHL